MTQYNSMVHTFILPTTLHSLLFPQQCSLFLYQTTTKHLAQDKTTMKTMDLSPDKSSDSMKDDGIERKTSSEETSSTKSEDKKPAAVDRRSENRRDNERDNTNASIPAINELSSFDKAEIIPVSSLPLSTYTCRSDSNFDHDSSVASAASKTSKQSNTKARKKAHNIKRRSPPVVNVVFQPSGQSSISTLSNSFTTRRPRRNSLSDSNRSINSHELECSSSVATNLSNSSQRIGLMGRLLTEMHIIENECFDDDDDDDDDDVDSEFVHDDDIEDWL